MKCATFYVMCLSILYVEADNPKLNDYLNNKSEAVQETFLEKLKKEVGYFDIEEDTKSEPISGGYRCVFSLFNVTFVLSDNQIYKINVDNGTLRLSEFKKLEERGNIEFIKVTQFEDLGLILIKTIMEIDVYGYQNNEIFFVHSILAPYATDVHFFVNHNSLYMIVINNRGEHLAVSIIYKWLGTYFDESEPVFTTGALKVTSFTHNFFEIIVILQYSSSTNLLSTVYEFNYDRIRKIQYIQSSNPSYVDIIKSNFGAYVLLFEKSRNNLVYGWDGSKLVKTSQFQTEDVINKSVTITSNNSTTIAMPLKNKIQIFHLLPKEIKLVGEKKFKSNFSLILDVHKNTSINSMIYIIGLNQNNTMYIKAISFKAQYSDLGSSGQKDYLNCFHHLENTVYSRKEKLKKMEKMLRSSQVKVGLDQPKMLLRSSATTQVDSSPQTDVDQLLSKLDHLQDSLEDYEYEGNNTIIKKKVVLKGIVEANTLTGKDVSLKTINDQKWSPQRWLRYKKSQNITGPITLDKILAKELNTATSNPLFTDLLTKNEHVDIQGNFQILNLTANKILTKKINDVELDDLYQKSNPQPIQGVKIFENLHTSKAKIDTLNGKPIDAFFSQLKVSSMPKFDNLLEVENLVVDTINGIHWNTFRDSVFRIGVSKEINGDLTLPEFKANNITLETLKNVRVKDLLTTSTDQEIDADIEFAKIFAKNITTNITNGIKLSKSAVQLENNTVVEVPVKFSELHVKNIKLIGELDEDFFLRNGDHIKGTNESDLWQIYEKTVKIKGNLYVTNLILESNAKLYLGDEEFNPDLNTTYWMKNTTQSIPTHFETHNLNVPTLFLKQLNGVEFNQYMLNKDEDRPVANYHFDNISVLGNVILNSNASHFPNLTKLNEEAVKTTGSYYIKGKKIYTDMLSVKNLETTTLDGADVNVVLNTKPVVNNTGKKFFKNIIIKGNLSCDVKSIAFLNGANITHLVDTAIYINEPQNIGKLHFKNVTVENLWVTKLNNYHVNRYIQNVQKVLASNKINKLTVNGNVILNKVTGLSKINDIEFKDLLNNTWRQGRNGGLLVNLEFSGPVKVKNLITALINDLKLKKLTKRFLYRSIEQNVAALYSFENIKTDNLVVSKINNISLKNLIDVSTTAPQTIFGPNGIEFKSVVLKKSLNVNKTAPCNLVESLKKFIDPPTYYWENVEVKGNATFLDPDNTLYRLFEKAVTNNTKNVVQSPVNFFRHVLATKVTTEEHINDINLQAIIDDAVLTESKEEQIITGRKVFPTITIAKATVMKNTDVPVVNKIDIPVVNKLIVRKKEDNNYEIKGNKTFFGGLQCENLNSEKVADIVVENIVTTENLRKIPLAALDVVEVENNLTIHSINSFDFDRFLKTRLLTNGVDEQTVDGVYFFDNIQVEDMRVSSINHITVDNVVFDIGLQDITAPKHFTRAVDVFGNLTCPYINGINISDLYEKSVGGENVINGSLTLLRPSIVKGNIIAQYINGYPVAQIKQILNQGTIKSEIEKIRHIQDDIVDKIKRNIDHIKFLASDYMYIEKTQALQISVPNTISAKTMESNDYVLIHVNGEESGENCGLPQNCKCPVQYSVQVSPEHSVAAFPNKGTQRIFTYNDDSMIIHFLTSSFSTDSKCRSEKTKVINEISIMTWNTASKGNITGSFHQYDQYITGYISGAEFFTLHGYTYAIIGRYYNPTTNTHDLDCYLIKFSHDKSTAEIIQEIPAGGAWSVYLFHTAQGVTLIIGNIKIANNTHQNDERTEIYRFDESKQRFDLLKIVPSYGCSMATGVVLGTDSLIVLAHRFAPLQVLKYNPIFDNYYLYQSFELEAPVVGISVFYTGGFGISDAYLCVVTGNENYFIYSFRFIEGWKLESSGELEGLRNLIPFELNKQLYLFAPSSKDSSLLTVVKHGSV